MPALATCVRLQALLGWCVLCMSRHEAAVFVQTSGTGRADGSEDGSEDAGSDGAKGRRAARSSKPAAGRRRSNAAEPGPPVGGALHRIDQWPPDCAADGVPLANQVRGGRSSYSPDSGDEPGRR